jgi:hypothetical protein
MVYIALGNPDEQREVMNADGTQTVWIDRSYWQEYEGTAWLGYRRVIVPARTGRGYLIFHEPVPGMFIARARTKSSALTFNNGVVSQASRSVARLLERRNAFMFSALRPAGCRPIRDP